MLEAYDDPEDAVELFLYSDYPFNMNFIEDGDGVYFEPSAGSTQDIIDRTLDNTPEGKVPNWVVRE